MDVIEIFPNTSIFDNFYFTIPEQMHFSVKKRALLNPKTDIREDVDGTLRITMELPGVSKSDVHVKAQDQTLIVAGEKRENFFYAENNDDTSVVSSGEEVSDEKNKKGTKNDSGPVLEEKNDTNVILVPKDRKRKSDQGRFVQKEITHGKFMQIVSLQKKHDVDKVKAKLSDGVLHIIVPVMKEETRKSRRIEIH